MAIALTPHTALTQNAMGEDLNLVQQALKGKSDAFNALVTKYRRVVYAVAYRYTRNHDEADDLAQETFIKAYEALASFRADASFKTWLLRIATNLSINTTKSGRISKDCGQAPHEFSLTDHHHGDENLIHEQRALRLREAIKQLPPRQKEALMLKTYEDMTCEEVATVMECSVGTVKANVFNALKKIRSILGDMA